MEVLIDTNVFIYREDDDVVPPALQRLERSLREAEHDILVHPLSAREIRNDPKEVRRQRTESKLETYQVMNYPEYPDSDSGFRDVIPEQTGNDRVDNMLLYSVANEDVDFLITEDSNIHKKASRLGINDQVFSIEEGEEYFSAEDAGPVGPDSIVPTTLGDLDLGDPIFDSLKSEYDGFVEWAESHNDRKTWINRTEDGSLGAILVIKPREVEQVGKYPPLDRTPRLKISTLKVAPSRQGSKMGELLISIAVREAISNNLNEIYLTHYIDQDGQDHLVRLIEQYGFSQVSEMEDGEAIFRKYLTPPPNAEPGPVEMARRYYPSFYDGENTNKFLVPIWPEYHRKLFPSYNVQAANEDQPATKVGSEGNAINKAYLSHSNTEKIGPGDILLFYRTDDEQAVTTLGICEDVRYKLEKTDEISRVVGKRSVFTDEEIDEFSEQSTTVILFLWHFDLPSPTSYENLLSCNILSGPLQTITEISNQDYKTIRENSGIDERFARH